jgi:hypothetical protein
MASHIIHNILFEKRNGLPCIEIGINFSDEFFDDTYHLIGEAQGKYSKDFDFQVQKNDVVIGNLTLKNNKFEEFMNDFMRLTEDLDFNETCINEVKEIKHNLLESISSYKENLTPSFDPNSFDRQKSRFKQLLSYSRENY